MEIKKIDHHNLSDINRPNQPFEIIGKIRPIFSMEFGRIQKNYMNRPIRKHIRMIPLTTPHI